MKRAFKNVRIVTDKGETLLISQQRYDCLIQTLNMLANGAHRRDRRRQPATRSYAARS